MPVNSPAIQLAPQTGPLAVFDTYSVVSEGEDPMHAIRIIPFSNAVLRRYELLIEKIQKVLLEMITNRITCIQRQIDRVFPKSYIEEEVPPERAEQIDKQIQTYNDNHPAIFVPHQIDYDIGDIDLTKNMKWYLETYD